MEERTCVTTAFPFRCSRAAQLPRSFQHNSRRNPYRRPAMPHLRYENGVTSATRTSGLEVQARLSQELGVSNLSALVRHGVATLDGMVQTENDRQRAEQLALEVDGVDSVVNELSLATPTTIAIANEAAAIAGRESTSLETAITQHLRSDAVIGRAPSASKPMSSPTRSR